MKKNGVLIDTSAWMTFLTEADSRLGEQVAAQISTGRAVICGVVKTELLQASKDEQSQIALSFLFDNIETAPMDETLMLKAGIQLQQLRSQGIDMPVTAALIAQIAIEQGISVLSLDPSFKHLNVALVEVRY